MDDLRRAVVRKLRSKADGAPQIRIVRQSIDARKKPEIFYVYTVDVTGLPPREEERIRNRAAGGRDQTVTVPQEVAYAVPQHGKEKPLHRPVIVGSGPAGLFCALILAQEGYHPLVIERGEPVEKRVKTVRRFWDTNRLDPDCNVQFGEGGAGTFSDGKLNTGIRDPQGRIRFVLETFVKAGADEDILYSYKPHIGTDRLREVITNLRNEIIRLGGEFLFSHRLEEIGRDGAACEETGSKEMRQGGSEDGSDDVAHRPQKNMYTLRIRNLQDEAVVEIRTDTLVLALGHSARDTFEMLLCNQMTMQPKAFAVGVRIQHPQRIVDEAMYGKNCPANMPPSPYKLTCQLEAGGVYSFCMCPGGYVVNASSEPGMVAVNGMSLRARDSGNANAAIVMTVSPEQYTAYLDRWEQEKTQESPDEISPLQGLRFIRMLEKRAFQAGGGKIPTETFGEFCVKDGRMPSTQAKWCTGEQIEGCSIGETDCPREEHSEERMERSKGLRALEPFEPRIEGQFALADVRSIFPEQIADGLEEAIWRFDKVIPGFAADNALLCAPESRTSSPVRICRDVKTLESLSHPGIYPCGEGAGDAGGITSAAVDGIRVAEAILLSSACRV